MLFVAYRRLFSFAVNDGHGILKNDCTAILAAFEWMYRKQLGRRNLTGEQKAYMIGKMYEARKNTQGGTGANQHTAGKKQTVQNAQSATPYEIKQGTAGQIGKEFGIDGATVRRNEHFAKGLDAVAAVSQEAADKILINLCF